MHLRINTANEAVAQRMRRRLRFSLASVADEIDEAEVVMEYFRDDLGMPLIRCRIQLSLHSGPSIAVEDVQSSEHLVTSRALDKTLRTLRRRLNNAA